MVLTSGRKLSPCEIQATLRAGEAYRGRDTRLDRKVAVKTLPELFDKNADCLDGLVCALHNLNLLFILDAGPWAGVHHYVSEFLNE